MMKKIPDTFFPKEGKEVHYILTGLDKQKDQRKIVTFFLPISFNICFGCSKEPSH